MIRSLPKRIGNDPPETASVKESERLCSCTCCTNLDKNIGISFFWSMITLDPDNVDNVDNVDITDKPNWMENGWLIINEKPEKISL